jgi:hypothetical protein
MVGKERFTLNEKETQSPASTLVAEIIKRSALHPDCQRKSLTRKQLESSGDLLPLLSVWEQSLQQFDNRLIHLVEDGEIRYNHHTIREIENTLNESFAQEKENQKTKEEFLSPNESFTQFLDNQEHLGAQVKRTILGYFKRSTKKLIGARAKGAEKSLEEIKGGNKSDWGRAKGGSTGRHSKKQAGTYRSY